MRYLFLAHLFIYILSCNIFLFSETPELFQVALEQQWKPLDNDVNQLVDGSWVLVGNITFIKKAKDPVLLDKIVLSWQGNPIEHIYGSLFRDSARHTLLPIEDYVVCDSKWSKKKQQLTLQFEHQLKLEHVNTFYLVLVVPSALQPVIKTGTFSLAHEFLPTPFKAKNMTT